MHQKEKPFSQIYHDLFRDKSISFEARSLAVLMGTFTNAEGFAWPGVKLLAKLTGWHEDTVAKYRSEAVKAGLLAKDYNDYDRRTGRFLRVRYEVNPNLLRRAPRGKK